MLKNGQPAPYFTIPCDHGSFNLQKRLGKKIVIFFFPKAETSGCTKEAIDFSHLKADFESINAIVLGISKDKKEKLIKFREKNSITCLLGSDSDGAVCETFGVWVEKSLYGRKYMGIQRATFVISEGGVLIETWPKVKVEGHAREVLEKLKES